MLFMPGVSETCLRANRSFFAGFALLPYILLSSLDAQHAPTSQLPEFPEPVPAETFSLNFAWDSRYVSKGRDKLENGGIGSIASDFHRPTHLPFLDEWYFSSWFAESISTPYTELNLSLGSSLSIEDVDVAMGYTWLDYQGLKPSDNRFHLQLSFGLFDQIDLSSDFEYSTEAGGTFSDLVASTGWEKENWVLTPYILLGINLGYFPGEHGTINNLQIGFLATTALSQEMEATSYLAATTGLEDIIWTGVSVSFGHFPHVLPQDPARGQH